MPIYEFVCPSNHLSEVLRPAGYSLHVCECGLTAHKIPSAAFQLDPPTGAATRQKFSLFKEASEEMGHTYDKVEADVGHPVQRPDPWRIAKQRAQQMIAAGEAPPARPLE